MMGILFFIFVPFGVLLIMVAFGRPARCGPFIVPPLALAGVILLLLAITVLLLCFMHSGIAPAAIPQIIEERWPIPVSAPQSPPQQSKPLFPEAPDLPSSAVQTPEPSKDPPRPAWMDAETGRVDNLYRTRIAVGPWLSRTECEQELPEALRRAVQTYAGRLLGEGKGRSVNLPMSYIHEHIVRGEWEERRQQTIDTMIYLHELLEFDRQANRMIEASYQQSVVVGRLGYIAAGGGALLGLLTILFGYLKLDTLTRGYYTGRLRLTAATAILGLAALAGLLVLA